MEPHVHHVISTRLQPVQRVVQTKRQYGERPVRLVTQLTVHRLAPEIVAEDLLKGCVRTQVLVIANGEYIIVYEIAVQAVAVA